VNLALAIAPAFDPTPLAELEPTDEAQLDEDDLEDDDCNERPAPVEDERPSGPRLLGPVRAREPEPTPVLEEEEPEPDLGPRRRQSKAYQPVDVPAEVLVRGNDGDRILSLLRNGGPQSRASLFGQLRPELQPKLDVTLARLERDGRVARTGNRWTATRRPAPVGYMELARGDRRDDCRRYSDCLEAVARVSSRHAATESPARCPKACAHFVPIPREHLLGLAAGQRSSALGSIQ
jgi:hypothetical protein